LRNIAIVLNRDYAILDFDVSDAYHRWRIQHPIKTYTVKSNRGYHVYLRVAEPLSTSAMQGGEILASGHMATIPCSVHKSGHTYEAINEYQILSVDSLADIGVIAIPIEAQRTEQTYDGICHDYEARAWLPTGGTLNADESPIAKIKRYASITKLLGYTSKNSTFVMCCPFHDDSTPSLQVWPADNKAYCHAPHCVAHRSIDVIDAAALLWKVDNKRAIGMLASQV
jgi:hypothetical protein